MLEEQDEPPCPAPRTLSEWAGAGPFGLHPASVTCSGDVAIFLEANDLIQATKKPLAQQKRPARRLPALSGWPVCWPPAQVLKNTHQLTPCTAEDPQWRLYSAPTLGNARCLPSECQAFGRSPHWSAKCSSLTGVPGSRLPPPGMSGACPPQQSARGLATVPPLECQALCCPWACWERLPEPSSTGASPIVGTPVGTSKSLHPLQTCLPYWYLNFVKAGTFSVLYPAASRAQTGSDPKLILDTESFPPGQGWDDLAGGA